MLIYPIIKVNISMFKTKNVDFIMPGFMGQNVPNLHKNKNSVNNIFTTFSSTKSIFMSIQWLKKASDKQNQEKTLHVTFE